MLAQKQQSQVDNNVDPQQLMRGGSDNEDNDDDLQFDQISMDELLSDDDSDAAPDEDLDKVLKNIQQKQLRKPDVATRQVEVEPGTKQGPEIIIDYVRNFLVRKSLNKTLECLQDEWYELMHRGRLHNSDSDTVPDLYQQNQLLEEKIQRLLVEVEEYKEIANKARDGFEKLKKERDYHRLHHLRNEQEKDKLTEEIKRLKKNFASYDPMLKQLQHKYESATKEKMLAKLDKDKLTAKVESLEIALRQAQKNEEMAGNKNKEVDLESSATRKNPFEKMDLPVARTEYRQIAQFPAHEAGVSALRFHPKKMALMTVSDDCSWKLWSFPSNEYITGAKEHKDWIADIDIHQKGNIFATASGDGTVKIWDFSKPASILTLREHHQPVWSCVFHDVGEYLVDASMDHSCKLWDLKTGKCKNTFRGHTDSVNTVTFYPFSNQFLTGSGDKTISLWDVRTGVCEASLYGHTTAINHVQVSVKGNTIASCDAEGFLRVWDIRKVQQLDCVQLGQQALNRLTIDPNGTMIAAASSDSHIKLYNSAQKRSPAEVTAHADGVQAVLYDRTAQYLVSGGSDGMIKIWQ